MADGRPNLNVEHGLKRPCVDPDCGCRAVSTQRGQGSILDEAAAITSVDRQAAYGHPRANFGRIAALWSGYLGFEVTPRQVALCMCLVKVARDVHAPKRDNLVDLAGYARTAEMLDDPNL